MNPWNQGSLVKRSVDGTEIHPGWAENLVAAISGAANRLSLDKLTFVSRTMAGIRWADLFLLSTQWLI